MVNIQWNVNLISKQLNEIKTWLWWYVAELSWQLIVAPIAYLLLCIFLYLILKRVDHKAWQLPGPPSRLLLVTAHPDDEVMFFGGHKKRKQELWAAAKVIGIPEANITILMNSELPDDPKVQWPSEIIADQILHYIEAFKINAVVTFDKHGVSHHSNHISLYYGIAALCVEKRIPSYCKLYSLESVNILRKYSQLLDLPISLLTSSYWYLVTYEQREVIRSAMKAHKSQYVWFRKLYMIFSRYTFINTLQEINILDLELDLQYDDD